MVLPNTISRVSIVLALLLCIVGLPGKLQAQQSTNYQSLDRGATTWGGFSTGTQKQHVASGTWYDAPEMSSINYTSTSTMPGGFTYIFCDDTLLIIAGGPLQFCDSQTVQLSVPAGFTSYQWSNGGSTASILAGTTGEYFVVVSDTSGCLITSDSLFVDVLPLPFILLPTDSSFCAGDSLYFDVGGAASTHLWSTGSTSSDIFIASGGNYAITVTNSSGCVDSADITVTENPTPTPIIQINNNILSTGTYSSYQWFLDGNPLAGEINQSHEALADGQYSIVVTDNNGCQGQADTAYTASSIEGNYRIKSINLYPNPSTGLIGLQIDLRQQQELNISIINNLGIEVRSLNSPSKLQHTQQLDLSHQPKGVYHVLIMLEDEVVRKAFVLR